MIKFDKQGQNFHFKIDDSDYYCLSGLDNYNENLTEYGLLYLYSPYYTAENDYKKIRLSESDTLGWIIPINIIDETDANILEDFPKYLKIYASIALKKLLNIKKDSLNCQEPYFQITKFYPSEIFLFVFRTSIVKTFDIDRYIPSLYDNGFYYLSSPNTIPRTCYQSSLMNTKCKVSHTEKKFTITLQVINQFDNNKTYVKLLYSNFLPWIEDPFFHFLVLYQVIEMLMGFQFNNDLTNKILLYQNGSLDKNSLREALIDISKESNKIQGIFDNVVLTDEYKNNFIAQTKALFNAIGVDSGNLNSFSDYLYKLRNTIFHSMRNIASSIDEIKSIIENFDKCIFDVLKTSPLSVDNTKLPFIIDMNKSTKTNKRDLAKLIKKVK